MSNLLSLTPLTTVQEVAEVYVVYNNQDYRMSLATLVSLVTKARLGLDRVDNTSDLEKPASQQVAAALASKANADEVPTLEAFTALSASIQNFVTQDQLNTAISQISQALQSKLDQTQLDAALATALAPITQDMQQVTGTLSNHGDRITALEQGGGGGGTGGITQAELDAAIAGANQYTDQTVSALSNGVNQQFLTFSQQLSIINQTLSAFSTALSNKADKDHSHNLSQITGAAEFIQNYLDNAGVVIAIPVGDW